MQQDTALRPAPEKSTFRNSDLDLKSNLFKFGPFWSNFIPFFLHFPLFDRNEYSEIPYRGRPLESSVFRVRSSIWNPIYSSLIFIQFNLIQNYTFKTFPSV